MIATNVPVSQHHGREHYRPPVGVPLERRQWWGVPFAALVHFLLLALLLFPLWNGADLVVPVGAGGPGPAGGGGGGGGGAGGVRGAAAIRPADAGERLRYVSVGAPPRPAPTPSAARVEPTPEPRNPVVRPPEPVLPDPVVQSRPEPVAPVVEPRPVATAPSATSVPKLAMGGSGDSGSTGGEGTGRGEGPGSGGGVGTGTGTGQGSGSGAGSGGGEGQIYPATPEFMVMPALPVPSKVRGKTIRLVFTIDAAGRITSLKFDSTGDSGYDRELRSRLLEYRFRAAHRADGTPVASTYVTELTL